MKLLNKQGYKREVNITGVLYRKPHNYWFTYYNTIPKNTIVEASFDGSIMVNYGHRIGKPAFYQQSDPKTVHFYEKGEYQNSVDILL